MKNNLVFTVLFLTISIGFSQSKEELEAEIKDLLRQVREESGKAGRGEKHKSIDGLFKRIHAAREEKKLLSRDVEPENG